MKAAQQVTIYRALDGKITISPDMNMSLDDEIDLILTALERRIRPRMIENQRIHALLAHFRKITP